MLQLRDYQDAAIDMLRDGFRDGHQAQILYLATGGGKTEVAISLLDAARRKGTRAAMLLDRIVLCDQTSKRLDKYSIDHGVLQSGHWRYRPSELIQVCSAQTIEKRGSFPGLNLLIIDECFPAGTLISTPSGEVPIHLVRSGDIVHNSTGVGRVLGTMARPASELLKLEFEDGSVIECTSNHPVFTTRGWVVASEMEIGEGVFTKQGLCLLWKNFLTTDEGGERANGCGSNREGMGQANKLLSILLQESQEPHEQSSVAFANEEKTQGNKPQTNQAWRERKIATAGSTCLASRARGGVGGGIFCGDEDAASWNRLSNVLQDRHSLCAAQDWNRTGREQSHINRTKDARLEEDRVSCFPRLVNISLVKSEGVRTVFNLHISGHPSYFANGKLVHNCHNSRSATLEFIKANPHIKVVGLTATPFTKGLGATYSNVVSPITTKKLVDAGSLVPLRVFVAKEIDMEGAKKVAGEWSQAEATSRGKKITGDIVAEWVKKTHEIFGKPEKTIVFCAGVDHGIDLQQKFQEQGYNFVSISYRDDDDFKRDIIEDFNKPDSNIIGLIATDLLTKGFDSPAVRIGVSARPFSKSLSSHIQQMGRVMRPYPGKDFGIWLDHSGNYLRFRNDWEDVFENGVSELEDGKEKAKKEPDEKEKKEAKCPACGALWPRGSDTCAHCGHVREKKSLVQSVPGMMEELGSMSRDDKQKWWNQIQWKIKFHGWSSGRGAHVYREKFGVWPRGLVDGVPEPPGPAFEKHVRAGLIRYMKGKR